MELELKIIHEGFRTIHLDEKRLWFVAFEFVNREANTGIKQIFSKLKDIDRIPNELLKCLERIRFRKSNNFLRRYRHYP